MSTSLKKVAAASAHTVAPLTHDASQDASGPSLSLLPQVAALEAKAEVKAEALSAVAVEAGVKAESKIETK